MEGPGRRTCRMHLPRAPRMLRQNLRSLGAQVRVPWWLLAWNKRDRGDGRWEVRVEEERVRYDAVHGLPPSLDLSPVNAPGPRTRGPL